jgi:crossover junction endodeoxyribonuclease RuvC
MPIFFDMPVHEITTNGKRKRQLDLYALGRIIDSNAAQIERAIIEAPHAMPGQGVTSCFNFGFNCGAVQGIIAANLIPMRLVAPATWKKAMGLSKDKDASRLKASQICPSASHLWCRVKDDGRAESFLLGKYGESLS